MGLCGCENKLPRLDPARKWPTAAPGRFVPFCHACWRAAQATVKPTRGAIPPAAILSYAYPKSKPAPSDPSPARKPLPVLKSPCRYLGEVTSECRACSGAKKAARNLHACLHDDAPWDQCRRGEESTEAHVQNCHTCPLYAATV